MTLTRGNGAVVHLNMDPFADGGEAYIYEYKGEIYKIFKEVVGEGKVPVNLVNKEKKVEKLIKMDLPLEIVKPIDKLFNGKKFVGYVMKKVVGVEVGRLTSNKYVKANNINFQEVMKVVVSIRDIVIRLHNIGIFVGDLNDANILFNDKFEVYFLDCDSWVVDGIECDVAVPSFKDPMLRGTNFNKDTDAYSLGILAFQVMARCHPFAGQFKDGTKMALPERMLQKASIIDNKDILLPRTVQSWNFIPPKLIGEFKDLFDRGKRFILGSNLDDLRSNLRQCQVDGKYYYSKFTTCPYCDLQAKVITHPQKAIGGTGKLIVTLHFSGADVGLILLEDIYINTSREIVHRSSGVKCKQVRGERYYFSNDGTVKYAVKKSKLEVSIGLNNYIFDIAPNSQVVVKDKVFFYVDAELKFCSVEVLRVGNSKVEICRCAVNHMFNAVAKDCYFVCHNFENRKMFNINGSNFEYWNSEPIKNYGIHYDKKNKTWLCVLQYKNGIFDTMVFKGTELIYQSQELSYSTSLNNICIDGGTIFIPKDGTIRGFAFSKNAYKDFVCPEVDEDCNLEKDGNVIIILAEKAIYKFQ